MKLSRDKKLLEISNKEILELHKQTEYNQVGKNGMWFEISLSHKGLNYKDEPHIFWGEVQDTIRARKFKGLTLSVTASIDDYSKVVYDKKITSKDFNELLPEQLKKDLQKMNQDKKKGFKPRAKVRNDKAIDMQVPF